MARHTKKNFYAVIRGHFAPAVCTSWGVTQALVSGYPHNEHRGFITLNEAISFIEERGHPSYRILNGVSRGERAPSKGEPCYYAVANGENVGVYEFYQGGAQKETTGYSHSCHKSFKTREEAEEFIKEYRSTADLVKRQSLDGEVGAVLDDMISQLCLE